PERRLVDTEAARARVAAGFRRVRKFQTRPKRRRQFELDSNFRADQNQTLTRKSSHSEARFCFFFRHWKVYVLPRCRHRTNTSIDDFNFMICRAVLTHERLNKNGWKVKSGEFARTDLNVQALAPGTIQVANSQVMDPMRDSKRRQASFSDGEQWRRISHDAKNEIKDCKDIDGKRFAIHGVPGAVFAGRSRCLLAGSPAAPPRGAESSRRWVATS